MRVVVQRVSQASVKVDGAIVSEIEKGFLLLVGIEAEDGEEDLNYLYRKIANLRVFDDADGVMNRSIMDVDGDIIAVSQFTLMASTKKGNRPSYIKAAHPTVARPIYEQFVDGLAATTGKPIQTGRFGEHMDVALVNDGPITIIIDSKNRE